MEREIKFRGVDSKSGEWVYGSLVVWPDGDMSILSPSSRDKKKSSTEMEEHYVEPDSVGQYTSYHDCEGREIYEGDIVELGTGPRETVIFKNGRFAVVSQERPEVDTGLSVFIYGALNSVKVLGTKFRNTELL